MSTPSSSSSAPMTIPAAVPLEPDKRIASRGKEPSRLKTHWDYVLEEMAWLAKDFESERKMKISQAKKIAVKVCKSGLSTESKGIRRQKEEEQRMRKLASNIAKDVKKFWMKIEKLILYKHQLELEGRKKKALDKHLDFLVGQTERYSTMLAEIWLDTPADESRPPSASGGPREHEMEGDAVLVAKNGQEIQNRICSENGRTYLYSKKKETTETVIVKTVEPKESNIERTHTMKNKDRKDDDTEFSLENTEEAEDDLSTMEADEALITEDERKEELLALERESSLPIEEILKMYSSGREFDETEEEDEDDDGSEMSQGEEGQEEEEEDEEMENEDGENDHGRGNVEETEHDEVKHENEEGEKDDGGKGEHIDKDDEEKNNYNIVDAAVAAQSAQPTGFTFSTTKVRTKLPFLLKHSLREYQHIGLDWLVTMYERRLNGILADEMGLGKTIMTIALLAHLACEKGIWGPHLIVVPTSVMLNWETELMKWCPAFKVLTYFGNARERKVKRQGWSKANSFHVCITTYRLVIQDAKAFKRKKWKYLILDEAHLIKNWKSQRWQTLLNFNSKRRILLTGTPLQNDLMELWSLMHFLMPHIFQSHQQFRDWFNNPITGMVEGQEQVNKTLVDRLHNVLRPFILRRLKQDVEKQLPKKYEHVVRCRLSKRQRNLYEDFMASSDTQATLSSGNFLGLLNVLMQLRKVCNHPDLFEGRPIVSSFDMPGIDLHVSSLVASVSSNTDALDLVEWNLLLSELEFEMSAWEALEVKNLATPTRLIEELGNSKDNVWDVDQSVSGKSVQECIISEVQQALHDGRREKKRQRIATLAWLNTMRSSRAPVYGKEFIKQVTIQHPVYHIHKKLASPSQSLEVAPSLAEAILLPPTHSESMMDLLQAFVFAIPAARSPPPAAWCSHSQGSNALLKPNFNQQFISEISSSAAFLRPILVRTQLFFPDRKLIQFDCGKLQELALLLRRLKSEGHRALIFTQMTKMLDVLESFVNLHGYTYLRLDGSTKPEERQILMQRFNTNPKIFLFILSTRSGGVGVNLVGADTVIFYDSDWNPAMDQQAQDRCHRIGQTREVHIYRLISESTIEENILKKANQKRFLDDLVIQSGSYNTDFFKKLDPAELLSGLKGVKVGQHVLSESTSDTSMTAQGPGHDLSNADVEAALKIAEDEADYMALKKVEQEEAAENQEFTEEAYSSRMEEDEYADDLDEVKGMCEKALQSNDIANKMEVEDMTHVITAENIGVINADLDEDMDMLADVKQMAAAAAAAGHGNMSFDDQLCPAERYAMRFLEIWDPIVNRDNMENQIDFEETEWELDQLERLKETQEDEIDEDNEPLLYESWDTSCADEAYRQQLEALKQQEYEHKLQLEKMDEEMQDAEREEELYGAHGISSAEFRSKWKKAKFKSLKRDAVMTMDDETHEQETDVMDVVDWRSPAGLFVSLPTHEHPQRKRKFPMLFEVETFTDFEKKKMRMDLDDKYQMEEDLDGNERSVLMLLDSAFLAGDRKPSGFSISGTPSKNFVKLDKEKKKDILKSGDRIPRADPWMSAEDAVFCAVVHEYGGNWQLVSETLAGVPDGGFYRGRYRHPVHCRERFRQLLFKYTTMGAAHPMSEKNGATNAPLKVTEEHIKQLLDAVKDLPDDEWLVQRHFIAAITSLHGVQDAKTYRNSIPKLANSPHGRSFIHLPSTSLLSNTSEPDKFPLRGVHSTNSSPTISLVASALEEQEHEPHSGFSGEMNMVSSTESQGLIEPSEEQDGLLVDVEFLETQDSELPNAVQINVPASLSSSYHKEKSFKKYIRRFTKALSYQRYRLACQMSAEGEWREWAAAAGQGLGVVGVPKLHFFSRRRSNDQSKAFEQKKRPSKVKKKGKGGDIFQEDNSDMNVTGECPKEGHRLTIDDIEIGSTIATHNVSPAPGSGDMSGDDLLDKMENNSCRTAHSVAAESHFRNMQNEKKFGGPAGSRMPAPLVIEEVLIGDVRKLSFRETEELATLDQCRVLAEESIIHPSSSYGADKETDVVCQASEDLQASQVTWNLPSSEMQPVRVSSPDGRPMLPNFFPAPFPVPPDLQVSPSSNTQLPNVVELSSS